MILKKKDSIFAILLFLVIASYMIYLYMSDPFPWYDESGQFFIAKGLNHYSAPLSKAGGIYDVIVNNRNFNLDPGGFSLLLHFWTLLGDNLFTIRLLPLVFFGSMCFFVGKIAYNRTQSLPISILLVVLPFITPVINNRIVELRAYSMELCGTAVSLYLLSKIYDKLKYRDIIVLSLAMSFFCTSRYGFVLQAFSFSLILAYILYSKMSIRKSISYLFVYSLPLIASVGLIFVFMMRYQNSTASAISYSGYIGSDLKLLFSPLSFLFYINLGILLYRLSQKKEITIVLLSAVVSASIYFVLSLLNVYPWDLHRTISCFFLLLISFVLSSIEAIKSYITSEKILFISVACSLIFLFVSNVAFFSRIHGNGINSAFSEYLHFDKHNKTIFVDYHLNPTLRYLYEYGIFTPLAQVDGYPNSFILQQGKSHARSIITRDYSEIADPQNINTDAYFMSMENYNSPFTHLDKNKFEKISGFNTIYTREKE